MSDAGLESIRLRFVPMLRVTAEHYEQRVPEGYPLVLDAAEGDAVGIEIDPSHTLYLTSEGGELFAELSYRDSRTNNSASASREKFAGAPVHDRRSLGWDVDDRQLRNLISELMSRWNLQPGIIHHTDS